MQDEDAAERGLVEARVLGLDVLIGAVLAQLLGLRAVFVTMALLTLALLAAMTMVTDDRMAEAERDRSHDN